MNTSWSSLEPMFRPAQAVEASAVVNRNGTVAEWDAALEQLSGWPATYAVGRPIGELLVALEPSELPDVRMLSAGMSWNGLVALVGPAEREPSSMLGELRAIGRGEQVQLALRRLPAAVRGDDPNVPVPTTGEEVRSDAQRLALLVELMPGFIYTVDRNLVFTSSVGAGLTPLNLKQSEVVGMRLTQLWGTSDPNYEPLACHLRALAGLTQTYQDVCVGRSLEYRLRPLRDAEGNIVGVVSVAFDVTEREHAKEEQAKLTAQLRHAQKMEAIGRLAGGIAHDFNNLLTCIMGNLTLAENLTAGEARISHYLAGASAAAESAATLTRQLLAFGRKQVIEPRPLNLSALIARVEGMLERLIGESITLRTRFAPDLWCVEADPGQLEQVLVNLVVNARDAITGHGEIVVETQNLEVDQPGPGFPSSLALGHYVVLRVRDTGRGMSDLVRSKLFEPFFTTKDVGAGTGLGLATVYGAVQQNGGTITVTSQLGAGSTFSIYLPRVETALASSALEPAAAPESSPSRGGSETILLVEDEPLVLELAHCTLEQLGYQVVSCAGADEALRQCGEYQHPFDLLVTDVVMPRMNGKELASRVRSLRPGIAVLFSSGYSEDIIARQGVLDAGLHFIGKPYRPGELAAKVRGILDQRLGARSPGLASSA